MADPAQPWIPDQQPPVGGNPIALSPGTFKRVDRATKYVEEQFRLTAFKNKRGMVTWSAPGAWGWLAPGATITAPSGLTLGQGTVTLSTRDDGAATITVGDETVTVYNTCAAITGDPTTGTVLPLHWIDAWVIG